MRDVTSIAPVSADRRLRYGADETQFVDIFEPRSSTPSAIVMMIHGGFWRAKYDLTHASHLCAALAADGILALNVEYRRVGNLGGGWPGTFDDIVAACLFIRAQFPDTLLIACGHSAGGHLALRLGSRHQDLTGIIALAPVAVLRGAYELHLSDDAVVKFLGGTPAQKPREYDAACSSLHSLTAPAILIHGTEDDVVPISLSREYLQARSTDSVRLVELPGTGHMELIDPQAAAFETIGAAIADLLR